MEKFESKYFTIEVDEKNDLMLQAWLETSGEMGTNTYKEQMEKYVSFHEKYPMKKILVDTLNFNFVMNSETQIWVNQNIAPRQVAFGMQKSAFLVSSDFIAQLSVEQAVEEQGENPYEMAFFDKKEEAINWLLS